MLKMFEFMINHFAKGFRTIAAFFSRRFNSMGLARKFYLLYVLLLAIPVILAAVIIASNSSGAAIAKAMEQGRADIRSARATVEKNITICWHAVQLAKSNKRFIEVLSTRRNYSTLELVQFQRDVVSNIDAIKQINADLYSFDVYINNYDLYEFYPSIHFEEDVKDKPWFTGTEANQWTYNIGDVDGPGSADVFALTSELLSPANEHIGSIKVEMLSDVFFGPLYADTANGDQFMLILENDGAVHFNPKDDMAVKYLAEDGGSAADLLKRIEASNSNFVTSLGKYQIVVNWEYIPALKSYLLDITSMEPVNRENTRAILAVLVGCLLVLGFLSLATYTIVSVLMKKLRTVISLMRRVEHGDLVVDIPDLGNDEAGELNEHFRDMLGKINELIYTVYKKQNAAREAEIKSLHSQLNAHFIYNVLESIKMMAVLKFEYGIADSITALGRIMRYSMNWRKQYVHLNDEISNLVSYMKLMNLQREIPVELVLLIPDELGEIEVLKMMLQPLAENAMVHGLKQIKTGGRLEIAASADESCLQVTVSDNGCGMTEERLGEVNAAMEHDEGSMPIEGTGTGIGLVNINQRIKLFYGKTYGISAHSVRGEGTRITVRLPSPGNPGVAGEDLI